MESQRGLYWGSIILLIITGTAVVWGEVIALALFISHLGVETLPLAIMGEAILSMVFIVGFEQLRGRVHDAVIVALVCLLGVVLIVVGWELAQHRDNLGFGLYDGAQRILRDLLLFYVWNYISSYYESHARHLVTRLVLVSRVAIVFSGLSIAVLTVFLSATDFVWLWGGSLVLAAVTIGIFADEFQAIPRIITDSRGNSHVATARLSSAFRTFLKSPMMRLMSLGAFCLMFVLSIIYLVAVDVYWETFSDDLALLRWLGILSGISALVMLPVQYTLLPATLKRANVTQLTSIYPVTVGISAAAISALPTLIVAALADLTSVSLQLSLYDPIQNQMKNTLPTSVRAWGHTILDGLIETAGRFAAGAVLILLVIETVPAWAFIILGLAVAGVFRLAQYRVGKLYTATLDNSIASGRYGFLRKSLQETLTTSQDIVDGLLERLKSLKDDERQVLLIAEALAETGSNDGFETLLGIWPRCSSSLQAELLILLVEGWPGQRHGQAIQVLVAEALESEELKLRRAALHAMTVYPDLRDTFRVAQYLIDHEPSVSTYAAQLLLQHPSDTLSGAAHAQLKWLSKSSSPSTRALAVSAIVNGGVNRFGERVVGVDEARFLSDSSARVRLAVLPSATDAGLLDAVRDVSASVRRATIRRMKRHKLHFTRLLRAEIEATRHATPQDYQLQDTIRYWHLLTALATLNRRAGRAIMLNEVALGFRQLDYLTSLRQTLATLRYPPIVPIIRQLRHDRAQLLQAMMAYLGAIFGHGYFSSIARSIQQLDQTPPRASKRGEALADITSAQTARQLNALLTNTPDEHFPLVSDDPAWQPDNPAEVVCVILSQGDEWFPLLALYALSAIPREVFHALTEEHLVLQILERGRRSQQDAVREGTRLIRNALKEEITTDRAGSELSRILPNKRDGDANMLSTIERMLFLRNVTFFENLRLDQLRTLARICEELSINEGEYLLRKGEAGDSLYVIVEGQLDVINPDNANDVLVSRGPGDVLGEISLFDGGLRSADVKAITPALMMVVYRDALDNALADDPGIALDMLRAIAQLVRENNKSIAELSMQLTINDLAEKSRRDSEVFEFDAAQEAALTAD